MKLFKIAIAAALAMSATSVYAFHSGGVAECNGCHSMHSPDPDGSYLLVGETQSDACLTCHGKAGASSYHIATPDADMPAGSPPYNRTPGGDFGWLKKTYTFVQRGSTVTDAGQNFGHNIMATGNGYVGDTDNPATSPGGSFDATQLQCSSCHDPHGRYRRLQGDTIALTGAPIKTSGSYYTTDGVAVHEPTATEAVGAYRILAGNGYAPDSYGSAIGFTGVPAAKVPSTYNRTEATTQTRVSYGAITGNGNSTWGNWCGACHGAMHSSGNYVHPVDQALGTTIAANYNAYVKSGNMNGAVASSFSSLAPFASAGTGVTYATLAASVPTTDGPSSTDQVNCMSCHRAHATGWDYMLRWNMEGEFMIEDGAYGADRGRTETEVQKAYYDRPATAFATFQRVYCNKCHAKD